MPLLNDWTLMAFRNTQRRELNIKVRFTSTECYEELMRTNFYAERTRYSNPLKQKFKAKRMAAESWCYGSIHLICTLMNPL